MPKIQRLLIANRGEIAARIIRAARELEIETVAVYSERDQGALHVRLADHAVALSGARVSENYLHTESLLNALRQSGADALHPGYGFFAESAEFARAVVDAGAQFIGPEPDVIERMGDKDQARQTAEKEGVPVIPGTTIDASEGDIAAFVEEVGFPLMVKAVAGGSGRGMRVVRKASELQEKIDEATREAEAAFGRGDTILEKYLEHPRHIEAQVFGDGKGRAIHFGERECSVQRRQQKLVEESPAASLHPALRERLLSAAVALTAGVSYRGAGTIEFLVEGGAQADDPFYFLEMNTRIQVEHPVSEIVSGHDLVRLQLELAVVDRLDLKQSDISFSGHAIEFRMYAEDPKNDFKPASGELRYLSRPGGPGVREDGWVESGTEISPFYDSLFSKLIISGRDREHALSRARRALYEYVVDGVPSTADFHRWLCAQDGFVKNEIDVYWLERNYDGQTVPAGCVGPLRVPRA